MPHDYPSFPSTRLRRLRQHEKLRELICETSLSVSDFILPLFVKAGSCIRQPIASMPGHFQMSIDALDQEIQQILALGIPGIILFGVPDYKNSLGSGACLQDGLIPKAITRIKKLAPSLLVITDVCFCEYTDHGHCGIISDTQPWTVDNDRTLELLAKQAVVHAQAGADMVAPSGMMDGMVGAIRGGLDHAGFPHVAIMSYSAKYCSALYAPFREAAENAAGFGNRKSYQMDTGNGNEALREVALDVTEGADIVMVKPAGFYLDVIHRIKQAYPGIPLAGYQVSGEFSMIKAAARNGWLDEQQVALESLLAIKRAGAQFILSYFAKDVGNYLAGARSP